MARGFRSAAPRRRHLSRSAVKLDDEGTLTDELIGQPVKPAPSKRWRSPKWQQQMEAKAKQQFVSEMLETALANG